MLAAADIEGAVDDHVERKAGARAELEHADAALSRVCELYQPHARDLVEPPDAAQEVVPAVARAEEVRHPGPTG